MNERKKHISESSEQWVKKNPPIDSKPEWLGTGLELDWPDRLAFPGAWAGHIPFAFFLVDLVRPRKLVELGVHSGNSYCAFLQAVAKLQLETECVGVDHWKGDEQAGFYDGQVVLQELQAYHDTRYSDFSTLLRASFDAALDLIPNGSVDILHIDGCHTYEAVKHDFESWLPKTSSSAVVLLHDINVYEPNFGVWRYWKELQEQFPSFSFLHSHGLGVAYVGHEPVPERLRSIFDASSDHDSNHWMNKYFQRLGDGIQVASVSSREIAELKGAVGSLEEKISLFDNRIAGYDKDLSSLTDAIGQSDSQVLRLNSVIADREKQIAHLGLTIASRDAALFERDVLIARLTNEATERDKQILRLNGVISDRDVALLERDTTVAHLTAGAAKRADEIRSLQHLLDQLQDEHAFTSETRRIRASYLFDAAYYQTTYPDLREAHIDPATHYLIHGWREHRNPSALFNTAQYLIDNPDVEQAGVNPLVHYLKNGKKEGRRLAPAPIIGVDRPSKEETESPAAVSDDSLHRALSREELEAQIEAIRASGMFDARLYISLYEELGLSLDGAIRHYCEQGWRDGLNPSDTFDTNFYLTNNPDIREAGLNPFWHYVTSGFGENRLSMPYPDSLGGNSPYRALSPEELEAQIEAIRASGMFDAYLYTSLYGELGLSPDEAIRHYCERGWRDGFNPSDEFDTNYYLANNPDIRRAGLNPFWHYVTNGFGEHRLAMPYRDGGVCEEDVRFGAIETDIKLVAMYEIPRWDALKGGQPAFSGHAYPPQPADPLGLYIPTDPSVLLRQAQLAKRHGFYAFCFKLDNAEMEQSIADPIQTFLVNRDIDFGFCAHVVVSPDTDAAKIVATVTKVIDDPRQIQIDGRPVLVVSIDTYDTSFAAILIAIRSGLEDSCAKRVFIVGRIMNKSGILSPRDKRFDVPDCSFDLELDLPEAPVAVEGSIRPTNKKGTDIFQYQLVASHEITRAQRRVAEAIPPYLSVTLARDTTSEGMPHSVVYTQFNLLDYRRWLDAAIRLTRSAHADDRRLLFLNAWNSWDRGLFVEPDKKGGFGRLNETSRALLGIESLPTPKISVIVPNYNHERFLRRRLTSIYNQSYKNIEVVLMDDCSTDSSRTILNEFAAKYPDITRVMYNVNNSGGPFFQWAKGIKSATGNLIWIAESDDYCDERFLENLVRSFDDEAVLLAYGSSIFVDQNEEPIVDNFANFVANLSQSKWSGAYVETAHNEVSQVLGIKNTIPNASAVLFRRPLDLKLLDDESWLSMHVAGDWVFYLHILRGGKIAYRPDAVNYFRRYEGSSAEVTYKNESFFHEVGIACRATAELYDVPLSVLESCRDGFKEYYDRLVGRSAKEFDRWFDYEAVVKARRDRLPNIMVSTSGFHPGGAEIVPIRLANELKRKGHSVLLLSTGTWRNDAIRKMLRADVPVVETRGDLYLTESTIREFGIEALNTHQWHIQSYPSSHRTVFYGLHTHVATLHGMIENQAAFKVSKEELLLADQNVTTWVYTADKNLAPFKEMGIYADHPERFEKIPNGTPVPEFITSVPRVEMGLPENAFVLCCVSRAIPEKGWSETVAAVDLARSRSRRDIRLILVGNGKVYDEYCRVGVPSFVHLAGFSENSVGYYAASDMGIMLTKFKSESFPLTVLDCLFAGKPYIATNVGEISNMLNIDGEVAGAVIELTDWQVPIEQAADIIAGFAEDHQRYLTAKEHVGRAAERYRIDVVVSQYIELFATGRHNRHLGEKLDL